jgi:hypothetical protein
MNKYMTVENADGTVLYESGAVHNAKRVTERMLANARQGAQRYGAALDALIVVTLFVRTNGKATMLDRKADAGHVVAGSVETCNDALADALDAWEPVDADETRHADSKLIEARRNAREQGAPNTAIESMGELPSAFNICTPLHPTVAAEFHVRQGARFGQTSYGRYWFVRKSDGTTSGRFFNHMDECERMALVYLRSLPA